MQPLFYSDIDGECSSFTHTLLLYLLLVLSLLLPLLSYFYRMQFGFSYNKKKVLQALRYHFISRPEIKTLMILVNVFAIASAALFYFKKIRPEPFLLGTTIWLLLMVSVWYLLPYTVYRRAATFKDAFIITFNEESVHLENPKGYMTWVWSKFSHWIETPHFFHLYFDAKSFFLVPKDDINDADRHELRGILNTKIGVRK